ENLRELALVISREAAGVGVGRVRMELCGRGEVATAFGHLTAQTVGFFARLNSNLADQEARAIGEPRLVLLDVLLDFFGGDAHSGQRDLSIVFFDQQVSCEIFAARGVSYRG